MSGTSETTTFLGALPWRQAGPFRGGRSVAAVGDPRQPRTFYFGACAGGVWKTTTAARTGTTSRTASSAPPRSARWRLPSPIPTSSTPAWARASIRGNVSHGDGVYKLDRRRRDLDAHRPGRHAPHRARARPPARPRHSSTSPPSGTRCGPNAERGVYRSRDGGADLGQGALPRRRTPARSTSRWTRPIRASSTPRSGRRSARPGASISGGAGQRPLQVDRRRRHLDRADRATRACRKGLIGKHRRRRLAGAARSASGRIDRGRRRAASSAPTTAARPGSASSDDRELRQRAWYYTHIFADPHDADTRLRAEPRASGSRSTAARPSSRCPTPHGDNHDLWIDPTRPAAHDRGQRRRRERHVRRRRDAGRRIYNQPTGAVLPRHHRQPVPLPRLRRAAGQHDDRRCPAAPTTARSPRDDWYDVGGGESGYIAVRPDNPEHRLRRHVRRAA